MFAYCVSAAYQEAASVARHRPSFARHVERPWVRSKNVYIAEPAPELQPMCCEIGAPRREIGVGWTSTLEIRSDLENDETSVAADCGSSPRRSRRDASAVERSARRTLIERRLARSEKLRAP